MKNFTDFLKDLVFILEAHPNLSLFLFLFTSITSWLLMLLLKKFISLKGRPLNFWLNLASSALPSIVACLSFSFERSAFSISIVAIISFLEIVVSWIINNNYEYEKLQKTKILSIMNSISKRHSEHTIDKAVSSHSVKRINKDFDSEDIQKISCLTSKGIDEVSEKMVDFLSQAYGIYIDRIGVNVWINGKIGFNTTNDGKKDEWSVLFRRNTNEDPPIGKIIERDNTTFSIVKDEPGKVYFRDKRFAYWRNCYSVIPHELNGVKNIKTENIQDSPHSKFENESTSVFWILKISEWVKKVATWRKLQGTIYCQNISISLNNGDQKIGAVFSVTTYSNSLYKKKEADEICKALQCYGYEIKSVIAEKILIDFANKDDE